MTNQRVKDSFLQTTKKLLLKAGYTVFRGDIRKSIRENHTEVVPPAHLFKNTRVCADRYEVLYKLPQGGTVVEVGVAYGDFTRHILKVLKPDSFIAIDSFGISPDDEPWGRQVLKDRGCSHYEYYQSEFRDYTEKGTFQIKQGMSWDMIEALPDHSVDYMYVDADHSYLAVSQEIRALKSKMKEDGIIQFNDYTYFNSNTMEAYGVPKAVHELMAEENYEMLYLCLHPQGFYDVVLKKENGSK